LFYLHELSNGADASRALGVQLGAAVVERRL
jgi:hypothetical protein